MQDILTVISLIPDVTLYAVFACVFPEDKLEQQHALFTQYKDPCRLGPGEDKPWALGNDTFAQIAQKRQCHINAFGNHYLHFKALPSYSNYINALKY